jgi:hypothetical protein
MKFSEMKGYNPSKSTPVFVGTPELAEMVDRDGLRYHRVQLLNPTDVYCSWDPTFPVSEWEEAYIRQSDFDKIEEGSLIKMVDEKKPEKGWVIPTWKLDLSLNHGVPLFSDKTIREWSKGNRTEKSQTRNTDLKTKLAERIARSDKK